MKPAESVRAAAARVLDRALASRAPLDGILGPAQAPFGSRDRRLLRELVLGSLRWLARLDAVLAAASGRPIGSIDRPLRSPLRIGAYQILFLERVPPYAVVDEAVREARRRSHRGGAAFVNGVLRRIAATPDLAAWPVAEEDPIARLAVSTSHPRWLVERWVDRFGRETAATMLAADNLQRPMQLLAFRDRGGRERLAEALLKEGIETAPAALSPLGLTVTGGDPLRGPAFRGGDFYIQDQASQAAALVPPPAAGERVLDLAAAPGGKSLALLAWQPEVRIVASDRRPARLATMRRNLRRLGRALPLVAADGRRPAFRGGFDRVLLDLPCTGTGTLARHPELKWRLSAEELARLARQAARLVAAASPLVRPGGLLIAMTCSLEPEENEEVAAGFLARHPEYRPLPLEGRLPPEMQPGIAGPGLWRVLPAPDHDGFTVHVLRNLSLSSGRAGRGGGARRRPGRGRR